MDCLYYMEPYEFWIVIVNGRYLTGYMNVYSVGIIM